MTADRGVRGMSSAFTLVTLLAMGGVTAYQWDWTALNWAGSRLSAASGGGAYDALTLETQTATPDGVEVAEVTPPPGPLCGDPRLEGVALGALIEPIAGGAVDEVCGAEDAIRLDKAAGVVIAPTAITNCRLASRLADWIEDGVNPTALVTLGASVARISQVADYVCRRRNNRRDGPLSEHAYANAIDIAAFTLRSGGVVRVKEDWRVGSGVGRKALFLQQVWRSACGPFTTVLGPLADEYHQDHFHLDGATRRQAYCR